MPRPTCRLCAAVLQRECVDLGVTPLCERYITAEEYGAPEPCYALRAYVCSTCFLVQVEALVDPVGIFSEYAYFSSYSTSWVAHAGRYADAAITGLGLDARSLVVEIGSNDGYLLQHFVARGIPVLGVDPAANVAAAAREKRVPTLVRFFGTAAARELVDGGRRADLIVANNVLAQVPDLHDFAAGLAHLLGPGGVVTVEVPHLLRLLNENQFDTIYHEHFSYFSLLTARRLFASHGLRCFDVEELPTHGGSLRLSLCHAEAPRATDPAIAELADREHAAGLEQLATYDAFAARVHESKRSILEFFIEAKRRGCTVVGYGAPGKGNTLLNYCGIGTDFIDYTVDRNPYKQGKFLPGSRIPIHAPERIEQTKPDYVFILPWNLCDEIVGQMQGIRAWGGRFVVPIPTLHVLP
jgi:SAM-dependent methyltransferase